MCGVGVHGVVLRCRVVCLLVCPVVPQGGTSVAITEQAGIVGSVLSWAVAVVASVAEVEVVAHVGLGLALVLALALRLLAFGALLAFSLRHALPLVLALACAFGLALVGRGSSCWA